MRLLGSYFGLVFVLGGCTSPGQNLLFAPERYPLIKPAKLARQTAPADLPKELHKTVLGSYIVEPGDGLLVLPADLDSPVRLPSDQTVLPDGSIDLGRYGRLEVAGRTVA
jgi:polysaccharide biosynthesis/export protein